jgi:flavin reductase (DIM6/NTAB) family NADH-FMN oxidoreductase RutF
MRQLRNIAEQLDVNCVALEAATLDTAVPRVAEFRDAMRHLASGVSLITTRGRDGSRQGMLATSVVSVTADPPTLLVCVNRSATMHDHLIESGSFCVNFLSQRHRELSLRFSSSEARSSRFETENWTILKTGAPALEGALSVLDCHLENVVEVGSHSVLFGKVQEIKASPSAVDNPLLYYDRQYGQFVCL